MATPITRQGSIYCRRCERHLGDLEDDGISIRFGNVRQYGYRVKYFCLCGKAYFFSERVLGDHSSRDFPEVTHEILNELGKDYSEQYLRDKNKKHDREEE